MGGDLVLATWWTTKETIDWPKAEAAIAALVIDDIESENFDGGHEHEFQWDDDEAFLAEVVRPKLLADLNEIRSYWEGHTDRVTDVFRFGPVRVLISGGITYGDDPSEMFTVMTRVPDKVAEAAGFFA